MTTFEHDITTSWTEVLNAFGYVAFDLVSASTIEVLCTETSATPSDATAGNKVTSWSDGWDFEASGMVPGVQRIWVKGDKAGKLRGIRG